MKRIALSLQWLLTTREGMKNLLAYGSYVFTILAGLVAVWAFVFPNSFGEALEKLTDTNQEILETNVEIAINTAGSKREVSDDPVIQLVNRGYSFTKEDFTRSIRNRDFVSILLFCDAAPSNWDDDEYLPFFIDWDQRTLDVLKGCKALDIKKMCHFDPSEYRFSDFDRETTRKVNFQTFCEGTSN